MMVDLLLYDYCLAPEALTVYGIRIEEVLFKVLKLN